VRWCVCQCNTQRAVCGGWGYLALAIGTEGMGGCEISGAGDEGDSRWLWISFSSARISSSMPCPFPRYRSLCVSCRGACRVVSCQQQAGGGKRVEGGERVHSGGVAGKLFVVRGPGRNDDDGHAVERRDLARPDRSHHLHHARRLRVRALSHTIHNTHTHTHHHEPPCVRCAVSGECRAVP
jgi:hypothetical protein